MIQVMNSGSYQNSCSMCFLHIMCNSWTIKKKRCCLKICDKFPGPDFYQEEISLDKFPNSAIEELTHHIWQNYANIYFHLAFNKILQLNKVSDINNLTAKTNILIIKLKFKTIAMNLSKVIPFSSKKKDGKKC